MIIETIILLALVVFILICNIYVAATTSLIEMKQELCYEQDNKFARVAGCVFYGPAFLVKSLFSAK